MSSIIQEDIYKVVKRVGQPFRKLSGKTILITGATGFVGSHLLETIAFLNDRILPRPCHVIALARNPESFAARCAHLVCRSDITMLKGDVRTIHSPADPFHFVVHAASSSDPVELVRDPIETMDVIVEGTKKVLALACENKVERFLFLSSGAVYGAQPLRMRAIPETYQGGPDLRTSLAGYGEAKRYAEVLCNACQARTGMPVVVARLFAFVGPYLDINSSFASMDFMRHAIQGKSIQVHGDGRAIRTLCYSADMVVALWKILLCAPKGEVYNVGTDQGAIPIARLARKVSKLVAPPVRVCIEQGGKRDAMRPRYVPNIAKLKSKLRFAIHYNLDTALVRTMTHLLEENRLGSHSSPMMKRAVLSLK